MEDQVITQLIDIIKKLPPNGRFVHARNNVLQGLILNQQLDDKVSREAIKQKAYEYINEESETWRR